MRRAPVLAALSALLLFACGSTVQGRGVVGADGGIVVPGSSGGAGPAYCSDLQIENECICSTTGQLQPNGASCSAAGVGNGVCCGDLQWPGAGLSCTCQRYACRETSPDHRCQCGNGTTGPQPTCTPAAGFTCCQRSHSYCECGPSLTCDTSVGDAPVALCSAASAQCPSSMQMVLSACQ